MEYNDYPEKMPENVIKKLNDNYGLTKVKSLSTNDDILNNILKNELIKIYELLSKSDSYFNLYKSKNIKINNFNSLNMKHREIIKSMCDCDYEMYCNYKIPRYSNYNKYCYEHYMCEMDLVKTMLMLLLFKEIVCPNTVCEMINERLNVINSLVLSENTKF